MNVVFYDSVDGEIILEEERNNVEHLLSFIGNKNIKPGFQFELSDGTLLSRKFGTAIWSTSVHEGEKIAEELIIYLDDV